MKTLIWTASFLDISTVGAKERCSNSESCHKVVILLYMLTSHWVYLHAHAFPLSHEPTTTHASYSVPFTTPTTSPSLLPSLPAIPEILRDRWVSNGTRRLVPSDKLPLIFRLAPPLPLSTSTHMVLPQKTMNHAPITAWALKISRAALSCKNSKGTRAPSCDSHIATGDPDPEGSACCDGRTWQTLKLHWGF